MAKIDPWGKADVKNYDAIVKEFGIESFSSVLKHIPNPMLQMRRGVMFGHREFGRILDAKKKKKPFVMMTGLMPSGKFHIGHAMLAKEMIYLQEMGAELYVCVADIEAFNVRRQSLEELRKVAIEEYIMNYIALGMKPKKTTIYFQSNHQVGYYRLLQMLSQRVTLAEMKAIYGDITPGKIMSVLTQVADILHPQLPENGGPKPVVVPVGIDQDPHIRLTRDLAARFQKEFKFVPPSSTYHEFMKGLKGGKMSSSDPLSYIAMTDDAKTVKNKIMKYAFSGGGNSIEEHRKNGGRTDVDVAYNMLKFMFEEDDKKLKKIHDDYESGKMLTGELKQYTVDKVNSFLSHHQKNREKARSQVDKFLK
jgi:tryptophanyl-tRNA synthetase